MKKILIFLIVIVCMVGSANALTYDQANYVKYFGYQGSPSGNNPVYNFIGEVDTKIEGAVAGVGDATIYYVNSGVSSEGNGTSWINAKDTLDEAINLCSAGDFIYVAEGHAESGSAADLWDADVAGITIVHFGNGERQGTYTFADTDTTVAVGAANVTIIGGRLLAGISEVVVGLSVEAAGDHLTVIGMEWPEPGTSSYEFNIGAQLTTGSDDVTFAGCTVYSADATGADHWLNGGAGAVNRLTLIDNLVVGEFAIAPVFSDQADIECDIRRNVLVNMTTGQHGLEFTGNATGICKDNLVVSDAIATSYDTGYMDGGGGLWADEDSSDTYPVPWTTNETGVNRWGASELAQIEGEATDAIEADKLDHLIAAADGDDPVDESIIADIATKAATSDWSDFDNTTDSLEAISDKVTAVASDVDGTTLVAGRTYTVQIEDVNVGDEDLFLVAGGEILITNLVGEVTTVFATSAATSKIMIDATDAGLDYDFSTAVDLTDTVDGGRFIFSNANPSVLTPLALGATGSGSLMSPWYCVPGMIEVVDSDDNDSTGATTWTMTYIPLVDGVTVTAQ